MNKPTPTQRRDAYEKFLRAMCYALIHVREEERGDLHSLYYYLHSLHKRDTPCEYN